MAAFEEYGALCDLIAVRNTGRGGGVSGSGIHQQELRYASSQMY